MGMPSGSPHHETLQREYPRLAGFIRAQVWNSPLADDLVQQVAVVFLEVMARGTDAKSRPIQDARAFLWGIARKLAKAELREARDARTEAVDEPDELLIDARQPNLEAQIDAKTLLDQICADPVNVHVIRTAAGWSSDEVAGERGGSAVAARVHLNGRRRVLRRRYADRLATVLGL